MVVSLPNLWGSSCVIGASKHQPLSLSTFFHWVYLICDTTCLRVINMANTLPSLDFSRLSKWMKVYFPVSLYSRIKQDWDSVLNTSYYRSSWTIHGHQKSGFSLHRVCYDIEVFKFQGQSIGFTSTSSLEATIRGEGGVIAFFLYWG